MPPSALVETGVERTTLANGLTVLSETIPGVRSVALGAWVRRASAHEDPARMGVSHLLEHLVFKGTARRGPREIALALESLGGSLDAWTGREHTSYQARVLDEHLGDAADVLADLLFHPRLRAEDLALEKKVILEEIAMVEDTPDDLVFDRHNALLWGPHPYGHVILGSRETLAAITLDDVRGLHAAAYRPEQVVVAAAGNVPHERLLDTLQAHGWADVAPGPGVAAVAPPPPRGVAGVHTDRRDVQQAHVVLGTVSVGHGDPARYAVQVASTLMGGGMSSRLFQRVREELGLAYSVYTFQAPFTGAGTHGTYVGTAPEQVDEALGAIRDEYQRVLDEGFGAGEVAMGIQQLKGQVTLGLESVASRMYRAAAVALTGEPFRPLDVVLGEIDAVTPDAVDAAARGLFAADAQTVVVLGPG
jgi:predicted Zn-dependent peptidase